MGGSGSSRSVIKIVVVGIGETILVPAAGRVPACVGAGGWRTRGEREAAGEFAAGEDGGRIERALMLMLMLVLVLVLMVMLMLERWIAWTGRDGSVGSGQMAWGGTVRRVGGGLGGRPGEWSTWRPGETRGAAFALDGQGVKPASGHSTCIDTVGAAVDKLLVRARGLLCQAASRRGGGGCGGSGSRGRGGGGMASVVLV